jgi:hypothetical protein
MVYIISFLKFLIDKKYKYLVIKLDRYKLNNLIKGTILIIIKIPYIKCPPFIYNNIRDSLKLSNNILLTKVYNILNSIIF